MFGQVDRALSVRPKAQASPGSSIVGTRPGTVEPLLPRLRIVRSSLIGPMGRSVTLPLARITALQPCAQLMYFTSPSVSSSQRLTIGTETSGGGQCPPSNSSSRLGSRNNLYRGSAADLKG